MEFLNNEDGNLTVSFSLLTPFIIFYFLWIVSTWQVRYIQLQTKAVLDFAVLGGATTGIAEKNSTSSVAACTIPLAGGPYGAYNQYGSDVSTELIRVNATNTLPSSVAQQVIRQTRNYWESDKEQSYQTGGIMHLRIENIKYRSLVPVLFNNWNLTIESSARCQPK